MTDDDDQPPERLWRRASSAVTASVTRRDVLVAGLVTVAAAGAGSVVAARDPWEPQDGHAQPPDQLVDALAAERLLLARIDRSIAANPSLRRALAGVRADHEAHIGALTDALRTAGLADVGTAAKPKPPAASRSGLRAAERAASSRAAQRAATLAGPNAVLLASIAACEASHAEALS